MAGPFQLHLVIVILLFAQASPPPSPAPDWPGLWGASRNGTTAGNLASMGRPPEMLWRRPVAGGYSEIVVRAERAYTMELRDGSDFIVALDAATGREQWSVRVGATYRGHGGSDDGPISTPAVDGNDLFGLGPHGHLVAVDVTTGTERWRHDLPKAFGAAAPTWGFAASPLIEGPLVIVPTGGSESKGLLAFDRVTGRLAWHAAVAKTPAYSSAVSATLDGVRQVIVAAGDRVFAVSPGDGRVLWSVPGPGGNIEVANSPIVLPGNRVLLSTWEEAAMIEVRRTGDVFSVREIWRSPRLRSSNGPTVYHDGFLYGFAGPQLICMDAATTEVLWRERTGPGTLIAVGARLVLLGQDSGEIQIVPLSPKAFSAGYRARVLEPGARAVTGPSFAGGRLFVRNIKEVVAWRITR